MKLEEVTGGASLEGVEPSSVVTVVAAIAKGAGSKDFFGAAYGQSGEQFEGFKFGDANVQLDDTLLLIEPAAAAAYEAAQTKPEPLAKGAGDSPDQTGQAGQSSQTTAFAGGGSSSQARGVGQQTTGSTQSGPQAARAKSFFGAVDVSATTAKMKLVSTAVIEIIAVLAADPNATVKVTLEIEAEFPSGASDQTKRAVSENASALGFKSKTWE